MQKEELLSQSYNFLFTGGENNAYSFLTTNRDSYRITFKPTPYLFNENSIYSHQTFEFSIILAENPTGINPPIDNKIPFTIASIFSDFFENSDITVAIYICDSSDGRQLARQRKFDNWYSFYSNVFIKIDGKFKESDGTIIPVSLIIKENNPFRTQIFDEFLNVVHGYNSNK
jgi:Family of unknown function (DUF6169)